MKNTYKIQTKFGKIAYWDNQKALPPILFLHGLSCSKEVFFDQFEKLGENFRVIAIDFLGHGESDDATDKKHAYTIPGFAESILFLIQQLKLEDIYIFGWSLGSSVATMLLEQYPKIKKVILHGYPPVSYIEKNFQEAFIPTEYTHLIGLKNWTDADCSLFANAGGLTPHTNTQKDMFKVILQMIKRSDGEMREILYASIIAGNGVSPKECVEKYKEKVILLVGDQDKGLNGNYFKKYFPDITIILSNSGHASFWDQSDTVNDIINQKFCE